MKKKLCIALALALSLLSLALFAACDDEAGEPIDYAGTYKLESLKEDGKVNQIGDFCIREGEYLRRLREDYMTIELTADGGFTMVMVDGSDEYRTDGGSWEETGRKRLKLTAVIEGLKHILTGECDGTTLTVGTEESSFASATLRKEGAPRPEPSGNEPYEGLYKFVSEISYRAEWVGSWEGRGHREGRIRTPGGLRARVRAHRGRG